MSKRFTGKNRQAAKFLGIPSEKVEDPGFCLGCGEEECECDVTDGERCDVCYQPLTKCECRAMKDEVCGEF